MALWQAPSTNNERSPDDIGATRPARARPYLDVDGRVRWRSGDDALPVGATELHVVVRDDGRRIFSTDTANERVSLLYGSRIFIR
jgi:hypothetical protein